MEIKALPPVSILQNNAFGEKKERETIMDCEFIST
jgi:hypothetical protein